MDGTDVEIEEYEEIVGNWDQASVREGTTDFRAVSIQDPTTYEQFNSMTHTERPALRPTERSFAGEQNESHSVVVKFFRNFRGYWQLYLDSIIFYNYNVV